MNDTNKTLKGLKIRMGLKGHGVVNYDDKGQGWFLESHCGVSQERSNGTVNENCTYAKKAFYKKENPIEMENGRVIDVDSKLKISSNALRNAIFNGTSDADANIWEFPVAASNYIANPLSYMRGYMSAAYSFGKKHCATVYDAIDDTAVITQEIFTKSGERDSNSLFKKETVGETNYRCEGYFDVKGAQFLSCDDYFGRKALRNEYTEGTNYIEQAFIRTYGRVPYKRGVYTANSAIFGETYGEDGLKMDDEFVNTLIKEFVKHLLSLRIDRANAEVHMDSLEICPIFDALDEEEWIKVKSLDDVPTFNIHQFYTEASHQAWEERKKFKEEIKAIKKAEKDAEKAEKKSKKSKAKNNETENEE